MNSTQPRNDTFTSKKGYIPKKQSQSLQKGKQNMSTRRFHSFTSRVGDLQATQFEFELMSPEF